jgi:protein TonB
VTPRSASRAGQPFERIFELGSTPQRRSTSFALVAALIAHAGVAAGVHAREEGIGAFASDSDAELAIEEEVLPPPLAPPPPEPPPPEPPKIVEPPPQPVAKPEEPPPEEVPAEEPGSSEAAQAGEVLVQEDDAEEEEDNEDPDDNTFVTGTADHFAGGATASNGTSAKAVYGAVLDAGGVPGGRGTAAAPPPTPTDRSRHAWLDGSTSWDCDFPGEADRDRIDSAIVGLVVDVSSSGRALAVRVMDDPGHGFGRVASACALKHPYTPALDPLGHPIPGRTLPFRVGFHR